MTDLTKLSNNCRHSSSWVTSKLRNRQIQRDASFPIAVAQYRINHTFYRSNICHACSHCIYITMNQFLKAQQCKTFQDKIRPGALTSPIKLPNTPTPIHKRRLKSAYLKLRKHRSFPPSCKTNIPGSGIPLKTLFSQAV